MLIYMSMFAYMCVKQQPIRNKKFQIATEILRTFYAIFKAEKLNDLKMKFKAATTKFAEKCCGRRSF